MQRIFKATAAIALTAALTHAAAGSAQDNRPPVWTQVRTVQGCLVYWARNPALSVADYLQRMRISFEGTGCQPGRVLTGEGTLVVSGDPTSHFRGRIVDGVLEGPVEVTHHGRGGTLRDDTLSSTFVGGCAPFWREHGACTPFTGASAQASSQPGPLGLQNMPVASAPNAGAPAAAPAAAANGDVFGPCVRLEGPERRGIQEMWDLRNVCRTRISLSYCLRADFEAAGDYNLCTRREYRTHSVAPGATVHFAFNLMPPGTNLSDGRQVTHNSLYIRGYACADDSSPRVHFDDGQLVFRGC